MSAFLIEDGASEDVTTQSCGGSKVVRASLVARRAGTCAALGLVDEFAARDQRVCARRVHGIEDGRTVTSGSVLAELSGPLAAILPIERTLLNLIGIAMGCATLTAEFVDAVSGTRAHICDTRKTIPGLRWLQKYSVECGGGLCHRWGLHDALLVKDNHVVGLDPASFAVRVSSAAHRARQARPTLAFTCAECDTLAQFDALLALEPGVLDIALLDNFSLDQLREAVARRDRASSTLALEASGGITLASVREIARCGVERISVGAITHSAPWHDVGLDIEPA